MLEFFPYGFITVNSNLYKFACRTISKVVSKIEYFTNFELQKLLKKYWLQVLVTFSKTNII